MIVSKYVELLYDKGSDLESSGRHEEAIEDYDKILELAPDYVAQIKGLSLFNLKKYQEKKKL
jgi:tetratricopeptide (TPR) repeat protein